MTIYCTYITIYYGNKLPPFYIGSSTVSRINKGYRGSVASKEYKAIWKHETKTNKHLFKTVILTTHETSKEAVLKERFFHDALDVVHNPLYTNKGLAMPNGFETRDQRGKNNHMYGKTGKRHHRFGVKHTEESLQKMRDATTGENHHLYGKTRSEETKEKIRNAHLEMGKTRRGPNHPRFGIQRPEHSAMLKGRPKPKVTCQHCGKTGGTGSMDRWHFDNCKYKQK